MCDKPIFAGYTVDGGFAEHALVHTDFTFHLPRGLDDAHAAASGKEDERPHVSGKYAVLPL